VWEEEEQSLRRHWVDLFPGLALARVMKTVWTGCYMEEVELKQQLHLLQQQIEAVASLLAETKLSLVSRIDMVGLEVEVLRQFLRHAHADSPRRYPTLREEVVREVDPEWTETPAATKPS
jgi:hypothetical protein